MNALSRSFSMLRSRCPAGLFAALLSLSLLAPWHAHSVVDDSNSFAMEAAAPYVKQGFEIRQESWAGSLAIGQNTTLAHQLFKGNEYWFIAATENDGVTLSVHLYDTNGKLAEAESWSRSRFAGVRVTPKKSGTHYIVVKVETGSVRRARWALIYGFR